MRYIILSRFLILIFTINASTLLSKEMILKGSIGETEILLNIYIQKKKVSAEYYEIKNGKGVFLEGFIEDEYINIQSERSIYSKEVTKETYESFSICEYDKGKYSGIWRREEENKKIWLEQIIQSTVDNEVAFNKKRLEIAKSIEFEIDDTITLNSYQLINHKYTPSKPKGYRHTSEPIIFPRIDSHPNKVKINKILDSLQREYIYSYMLCSSSFNESDYYVNLSQVYIDKFNLSILITGEKCCGPRCNYPQSTYNINLKDGKNIELNTLFNSSTDSLSFILHNHFQKLYPKEFTRDDSEHCTINRIDNWEYPIWYLTKEGIQVLSNSSYAYRGPCVEYWLFPNSIFNREKIEK